MQFRQNRDSKLPQPLIPRIALSLQMSFQLSLDNAPFSSPDQQPHFFDADLADESLAISPEVRCRGEEGVGLYASVEDLSQDPDSTYKT
jgi:hypothetical protein